MDEILMIFPCLRVIISGIAYLLQEKAEVRLVFNTIRSEFVSMYSNGDPLVLFASEHSISDALPGRGNLNLDEVLQSEHFFS